MNMMEPRFPLDRELPPAARGALSIVQTLANAGHAALLAGGCVRDLLLGAVPQDYDVATDAPPERIGQLFHRSRHVGAQFGVVLVRRRGTWIEVASFRSDGPYLDGRHPLSITLSDAQHDAQRRDFTVNGMFLDPLTREVVDYVNGRADLDAGVIRAIGVPAERFAEDYLRLLRAVRFAARLDFKLEPTTLAAIRQHASSLRQVAAERIREELEKILASPTRRRAWRLLHNCNLLEQLWPDAGWDQGTFDEIDRLLGRLPTDAGFEIVLAIMLADQSPPEVERIARALTLSNDQRSALTWLVKHQRNLDEPHASTLAELKRLMAGPAFGPLRQWALARYADWPDGDRRTQVLEQRVADIEPNDVQPTPLITGADLQARGIKPGPIYSTVLHELYTRQLNEQLPSRADALAALDVLLAQHDQPTHPPPETDA